MLPSNIARKPSVDVSIIFDDVDVMAALEDLFDESIRKQTRTKACGRTRESQRKRRGWQKKEGHRKKRPMKKRVDEL